MTPAAIDAYLAEVPLPEGWTEERSMYGETNYIEAVDGIGGQWRVMASCDGVRVWSKPRHWPPIPLPVLLRAAVQCHRLREAGR